MYRLGLEKDKPEDFLGNKRRADDEKSSEQFVEKFSNSQENSEIVEKVNQDTNILDLNLLYDTVSPPSELNEENGKFFIFKTNF